jgi:lipoprotein-anchoring transpeptidase ErfK/SrfK
MTRDVTPILALTDLQQRTNRRRILASAAGLSLILPGRAALGQEESPPIEPFDPRAPTEESDPTEEPVEEEIIPEEEEEFEEPDTEQTPVDGENDVDYSATQYFALSGHNLSTPFLKPWEDAGGEDILGIPLSEARFVTGAGVQQTFQTLTLGYEPDEAGDTPVVALPIDPDKINSLAPESARRATSRSSAGEFFDETGHGISGKILSFWNQIDGQRFLGKPLSEEFKADGKTQQLFEFGVIELDSSGKARLQNVVEEKLLDDAMLADPAFAPAPPTLGVTSLVTSEDGLRLRSAPSESGDVLAVVANNAEFIAAPGEHGEWVPGYADGYSGWVAAQYLAEPEAIESVGASDWDLTVWQGASIGETNVRDQPTTKSKTSKTLAYGDAVIVVDWVKGEAVEDNDDGWAQLKEGKFVYLRNIVRSAPVTAPTLPSDAPRNGRWIDVHLTQQLMVAYEDRTVKRVTVMTSGKPGWETPEGMFSINTRVPNETMDSGSIGAENFYKLEDVLFTQYFTNVGHALHFAWWKNEQTIGRPGSHGCLNLLLEDSKFYWDWATIGTPVYCHY